MKKKLCIVILILVVSMSFTTSVFAGPNENAGVRFDLNATTYGNQNQTTMSNPGVGAYMRVDCYAINVHNLDTYEFEVLYDVSTFEYIGCSATNPLTFEDNILTNEGGTAIGWMVDVSNPGVLSVAYTLAGADTLEAPEGEGLIADLVFHVLNEVGDTLNFGEVNFYDTFGELDSITDKDIAIIQGSFSIKTPNSIIERETKLYQNYPNPFSGFTTIEYSIPGILQYEPVTINIYNVIGQLVDTIEGRYGTATLNTSDYESGIYLYKLNSDSYTGMKKMMFTKP